MKAAATTLLLFLVTCSQGFQRSIHQNARFSHASASSTSSLKVVTGENEPILDKTQRILQTNALPFDEQFDSMVRTIFPESIHNSDLLYRVVAALAEQGFTTANTLLTTSLCSDELAKRLADDFVSIYGSNFNLGGLAGFPLAGNTGFQTMSGHIPDDGFCLLVYGPHVGLTRDGSEIGRVEREGVAVNDICCRSAIQAANYVMGPNNSGAGIPSFLDFNQFAVQNQMQPLSERLQASEYPMWELPYAIYEQQNELVESIVNEGFGGIKEGIALLGGVQINTGPGTLDYFHPLRFDLITNQGASTESLLPKLS